MIKIIIIMAALSKFFTSYDSQPDLYSAYTQPAVQQVSQSFQPYGYQQQALTYNPYTQLYNPISLLNVGSMLQYFPVFNQEQSQYYPEEQALYAPRQQRRQQLYVDNSLSNYQSPAQQQLRTKSNDTKVDSIIKGVINTGRKQLGKSYVTGTHGPKSFDCSGLLYYIFKENGVNIPLNIFKMVKFGKEVSLKDARSGDIIVTPGTGRSGLHVKMITGIKNGVITVLEAKGKKWGVVESVLKDTRNIKSIRRVI